MVIYDADGRFLADKPPAVLTGDFCRKAHVYAQVTNPITQELETTLVRAQLPHVVSLLIYNSKLQLEATRREYLIYAPADFKSAVQLALVFWKRWERGPEPIDRILGKTMDWYPRLEDGAVAEIIDDNCFAEQWNVASKRKYRAAGHPADPFAFTCLDQDVMLFKTSDFQAGLSVRV